MIETKKEKKAVTKMPMVCDFPKVFPYDVPGLPPERQLEFRID